MEQKHLTLAIHTVNHAMALKRILEAHDIEVTLQKFSLTDAPIAVGVRVLIHEKDLPIAIKVIESFEQIASYENVLNGHKGELLIPVDFNEYSMAACKAGFDIADHLHLQPVILHAFPTPIFNSFTMEDSSGMNDETTFEEEVGEIEMTRNIRNQNSRRMNDFVKKIKKEQERGEISNIRFKTLLEDGVAEDVIKDYCRMSPPSLVVMVTRGKEKKGAQLIGSVTAEVLDDCRVPVFSIPENCNFTDINKVKELVFFCNLDQNDLIAVDTFMRMFAYPEVTITLIPIVDKQDDKIKAKLIHLRDYFCKNYPTANFITAVFPSKNFMLDFYNYESQRGTEMIVVPNKRKNAFMRLFNPGIAHRLLFERDLPLLALPI